MVLYVEDVLIRVKGRGKYDVPFEEELLFWDEVMVVEVRERRGEGGTCWVPPPEGPEGVGREGKSERSRSSRVVWGVQGSVVWVRAKVLDAICFGMLA